MKAAITAALVALLVSAGSATAAFVVTSKNIKNGTIQVVDISKSARRALKGNRGPQGINGLDGAPGERGAPGATNVTVQSFSLTVAPLSEAWAIVNCPLGQRATGGGGRAVPGVLVYETHPVNSSRVPPAPGETPVGWRVGVDSLVNNSQTLTVYAVCAAP
jgi:hypothetical protein